MWKWIRRRQSWNPISSIFLRAVSSSALVKPNLDASPPLSAHLPEPEEATVAPGELASAAPGERSAVIRERVIRARSLQRERFRGIEGLYTNAMMTSAMLRAFCPLDAAAEALLLRAMERLGLSARAYDRILKVARTIADLAGEERISAAHVAEAINYRSLDRESWGR